jgi:2-polyprenyl-3-methyl-5-hydroxy-6-metoxy-1,4-benzoquinol methylase
MHIADGAAQERDKYAEIWGFEEYRTSESPGLINVERFMSVVKPAPMSTIIDIGCGQGGAGLEFKKLGLIPSWVDITSAALNPEVDRQYFVESPLWGDWRGQRRQHGWDYGFCCDVLEHIPPEYTMLSLDRIISNCRTTWLQIALRPDEFGKLIGETLHLTVRPFDWWLIRLATLGRVIDARDLCGEGLFIVERK